jgi:hypothetical protein
LVTNGDFATDSDWTLANAVISGGVVDATAGTRFLAQNAGLVTGKVYTVTFDFTQGITTNSGKIRVNTTATNGGGTAHLSEKYSVMGSSGSLTYVLVAEGPYIAIEAALATFYGTIDNVSVKEVIFDVATDPLVLYNHPANIPRIEYDATGAVKGLLIEESRTNILRSSGDLTGTGWANNSMTVGAVTTGSPFGTYQTVSPSSTIAGASSRYQIGLPLTGGTTYVGWSLVKYSAGNGWFVIDLYDSGKGSERSWFDVQNGVVGTKDPLIIDHGMIDYGDGWWLCWASSASTNVSGGLSVEVPTGDGVVASNSGNVVLVAGSQFEAGSFGSSYIPTTGAAATRAADVATIPTSAFGFNSDAGSVLVEAQSFGTNNYPRSVMIDAGSENNSIGLGAWGTSTYLNGYIVSGGVVQAAIGTGSAGTSAFKNSLAYKENDFAASRDGLAVVTDTSGVVPTGLTTLRIGRNALGAEFFNGHIKSIQYYPRRLSNAQLQELTT